MLYVHACRWVIVHGLAGFGKTVLAAEAVRDATILKEVFPGQFIKDALLLLLLFMCSS